MLNISCTVPEDCPPGEPVVNGNGMFKLILYFYFCHRLPKQATSGNCRWLPNGVHEGCNGQIKQPPIEIVWVCVSGVRTGNCVKSDQRPGKVCQIYAWCPVEVDKIPFK